MDDQNGSLAYKLEHAAQAMKSGISKDCDRCPTNGDLAEAARIIRQRDALAARLGSILDAIGDPERIAFMAQHQLADSWAGRLRRIADAADPDKRSEP